MAAIENRDDNGDNRGASMIGRCRSFSLLSLLSLAACRELPELMHERPDAAPGGMSGVPARGTTTTLDIASWNIDHE